MSRGLIRALAVNIMGAAALMMTASSAQAGEGGEAPCFECLTGCPAHPDAACLAKSCNPDGAACITAQCSYPGGSAPYTLICQDPT